MIVETMIAENYVPSWGIKEAIRELVANAIDAKATGLCSDFSIKTDKADPSTGTTRMHVEQIGMKKPLPRKVLAMGYTDKLGNQSTIGEFGEGLPLSLLVLARNNRNVRILNRDQIWHAFIKENEQLGVKTLHVEIGELDEDTGKLVISLDLAGQEELDLLDNLFLPSTANRITPPQSNISVLLDNKYSGKIYVKNVLVQEIDGTLFGYNIDHATLNRDRNAIIFGEDGINSIYDAISHVILKVFDDPKWGPEIARHLMRKWIYDNDALTELSAIAYYYIPIETKNMLKQAYMEVSGGAAVVRQDESDLYKNAKVIVSKNAPEIQKVLGYYTTTHMIVDMGLLTVDAESRLDRCGKAVIDAIKKATRAKVVITNEITDMVISNVVTNEGTILIPQEWLSDKTEIDFFITVISRWISEHPLKKYGPPPVHEMQHILKVALTTPLLHCHSAEAVHFKELKLDSII